MLGVFFFAYLLYYFMSSALFNLSETAALLGVRKKDFAQFPPTLQIGRRNYYSFDDLIKIKNNINPSLQKSVKEKEGLYGLFQTASILNCTVNWLMNNEIHFPRSVQLGKRLLWTKADLEKIKLHKSASKPYDRFPPAGFLTVRQAASKHEIPEITWRTAMRDKRIPKPTHPYKLYPVYTENEALEYAKILLNHKRPDNTFSGPEVAKQLNVCKKLLNYTARKLKLGTLPHPKLRLYNQKEIDELAKYFNGRQQPIGQS